MGISGQLGRPGERVAGPDLDVIQDARCRPPRVNRRGYVRNGDEMERASRREHALGLGECLKTLRGLVDPTDDAFEQSTRRVHGAIVTADAPKRHRGARRCGARENRTGIRVRADVSPPALGEAALTKEVTMDIRPTEPFREEHRVLLEHVAELRAAARDVPRLVPAEREVLVHRLVGFLREELLPHAQAEERVFYPEIAALLGAPEATAPMLHDHRAIRERIVELEECDLRDPERLQELLYGLYALISVHFEKEEDLYLSLLDVEPGERVSRLLEAMTALDPV